MFSTVWSNYLFPTMFGLVNCNASHVARLSTGPELFFVRSLVKTWLWPIITFFGEPWFRCRRTFANLFITSFSSLTHVEHVRVFCSRCDRQYSRDHRLNKATHDHVLHEQLSRRLSHCGYRLSASHSNRQYLSTSVFHQHQPGRDSHHDLSSNRRFFFEYERLAHCNIYCRTLGGDHLSITEPNVVHGASCPENHH